MPQIGLGTYKTRGQQLIKYVIEASFIDNGYRLIDTASVYRNEEEIARALKELKIDRKNVLITSKLSPKSLTEDVDVAINETLRKLDTDYVDLYLIHWPGGQKVAVDDKETNRRLRLDAWKVLESRFKDGTLKAIGVSNYEIKHINEILEASLTIPHVNQIEVHPYYQQVELTRFCEKKNIHVTAYSTLGTTTQHSPLLTNSLINEIARKLSRSPAQVLLRWAIQKGYSVVPKSTNGTHIGDNVQLDFDISDEDMKLLDSLERNEKFAWNPKVVA